MQDNIPDIDSQLYYSIIQNPHNQRMFQSIALDLHLRFRLPLENEIPKIDAAQLKSLVVDYLLINKHILGDKVFKGLVNSRKVDPSHFDFLKKFTKNYIFHKMRGWGIFDFYLLENAYGTHQPMEIIIGYLLDSAFHSPESFILRLDNWKDNLTQMGSLAERAKWFDSDKKKEAAQYIFRKKNQKKYLNAFSHDAEIFFLDERINSSEKELIFQEIRARYHLEVSRENNPKIHRNFSLNPATNALIEKLRRRSKLKKSEFMEMIFSKEHEEILLKLLDLKKKSIRGNENVNPSNPSNPSNPVNPLPRFFVQP